ncbi:MAG: cyclopropane-fatty-acyl-phospholipid synthase family protein [Pseudomonadota bacterium]
MANEITANDIHEQIEGLPFFFRQVLKIASHIQYGTLVFELPNGKRVTLAGKSETEAKGVILVRRYRFARRAIFGGDIGFFESFADGDWETPDLAACLYVFARNADHVQKVFSAFPIIDWLNRMLRDRNKNTKDGARRNIIAHYDLGNSFYQKWLDPTMTYSSARFTEDADSLEKAQTEKYESLARMIDLKPGERVLEIGSGWGGFAEYAAKTYGVHITGLTLSPSQLDYARERIAKAGLSNQVEFRLQDYRDVEETFDKVASIEMFEAVGKEYWPAYFEKVHDVLKPGGLAGLQVITIADRFFDNYTKSPDFIQRYVFPGGMLASPAILSDLTDKAGLKLHELQEFGQDYAKTLNTWHERFLAAWSDIRSMGFDERFSKLWRFYLAYCEAGFKAGTTNVRQMALIRP